MAETELGWNDALRFLLELVGIFGLGAGGWRVGTGPWQWILVVLLPVFGAAVWGTFRVPEDPGPAPVAVPGWLRLALEVLVLGGGAVGLGLAFGPWFSWSYIAALIVHYLVDTERVRRLLAGET